MSTYKHSLSNHFAHGRVIIRLQHWKPTPQFHLALVNQVIQYCGEELSHPTRLKPSSLYGRKYTAINRQYKQVSHLTDHVVSKFIVCKLQCCFTCGQNPGKHTLTKPHQRPRDCCRYLHQTSGKKKKRKKKTFCNELTYSALEKFTSSLKSAGRSGDSTRVFWGVFCLLLFLNC